MKLKITSLLIAYLMFISCKNNINIDLGNGYKLISSASFNDLTIVSEQNIVIIVGHILEFDYDSTFIIASQRPRESVPECTGSINNMTKIKCDEAFKKSKFRQYWIINKKEKMDYILDSLTKTAIYSNVYGPFNYKEYIEKSNELKISKSILIK